MTTSFVRRGIALYKMMDAETKRIYRNILNVSHTSKIIDIENQLAQYEHQRNNFGELISDMELEVKHLNKK